MKQLTAGDLMRMLGQSGEGDEKVFAYINDAEADSSFRDALRKLATSCYDLHAAMRWELCDGW